LIYSKDVDGNEFRFEYDNRNNLTAIRYSDGSSKEMNYYSKFKHDCIKRVKDRDGTATSYIFDIYNRKHYKVGTVLEGSDGKKLAESSYEYFVEFNAAGGEYTSRMISSLDGDVTDTEYNKSGLPVKITNKGRETRFRYDQMGNPTYKETNSEITELEYQQVINKVSRIRHRDKVRNVTSEVRYDYDNRGNLLSAEGDGKLATFENDRNGNIISIVMNGKIMRLAFNSDSKPVGMELEEESIALTYSENGGANITGKTANSIAVIERYIRDCSKLVNNEHVPNIYNHGEKCTCHRKLLAENVINMLENVLTELGNTNNKTGAPGLMR
jgi:YD repeat-containing protein